MLPFKYSSLFISLFLLLPALSTATTTFEFPSTLNIFRAPDNSPQTREKIRKLLRPDVVDETDDDYNDEQLTDNENEHARSHQRHIYIIKRLGITYAWGRWEKWSKCSNSCVQIRRRKCIERKLSALDAEPIDREFYPNARSPFTGCFGIVKRFRHCKDEKCKTSNKKQRDEQCASFNTIPYRGKFHNWLGYEKEHNECELYCRPSDSDVFVSMNQSVTDGTPCERPAVYYTHAYRRKAVCVEGICRAVHYSGAIRPATTKDLQSKCGSVLCQIVSEVFSKPKLNYGYNYVHTIPAGAMNLTIKQLTRSDNLLALKTTDDAYIINGNRATESGIFEYNDDSYDYNREIGMITAKGPLTKPVVLLLFVRGHNTGIKYDYTIPVPSASITEDEELQTQWNELGQPLDEVDDNNIDGSVSAQIARARERKRRKFSWKLLGFGPCNRACGPGIQPPIFRCIRDSPTRFYSPKRCAFVEKPVFSEAIYHCNKGLCPAYWRAADYGECKCAEGEVEGVRSRYVNCVQEQLSGKVEQVAESECEDEKLPELMETCNCPNALRRKIYARGPDKAPRVFSRLIGAPPLIRSVHNSTTPLRRNLRDDREDKAGVWLMSEWSEECSVNCGVGLEHRSIYCDRTPPYTDLCDLRFTPEQKRVCSGKERATCNSGTWFASEWSNCTGDCFNLQRKRTVLCLKDGMAVEEKECDALTRPREVLNCTHKEVTFCGPKWHYSEWSECSRSCGEGIQRRYAKCLEFDWKQNAMVESSHCKYLEREPVYGACNLQKCEELNTLLDAEGETIDSNVECKDEFGNCSRINRQRLCKLQYYKTYCCQACSGYA